MTVQQGDTLQQADDFEPKIDPRLIHILSNPIRVRFLELLSDRASITPAEAFKMLEDSGVTMSNLAYHARVLHDFKLVELVRDPAVKGGFTYRLSPKSYIEDTVWLTIPKGLRPAAWAATLHTLTQHSISALKAGTIEKRESQLDLLPVALDEQGWHKIVGALGESLELVETAHRESVERAQSSGQDSLSQYIVALTAFEASPTTEGSAT